MSLINWFYYFWSIKYFIFSHLGRNISQDGSVLILSPKNTILQPIKAVGKLQKLQRMRISW